MRGCDFFLSVATRFFPSRDHTPDTSAIHDFVVRFPILKSKGVRLVDIAKKLGVSRGAVGAAIYSESAGTIKVGNALREKSSRLRRR